MGPSLPAFLAAFLAVNLPFCLLNAARTERARRAAAAAAPGPLLSQLQRQSSAKVARD